VPNKSSALDARGTDATVARPELLSRRRIPHIDLIAASRLRTRTAIDRQLMRAILAVESDLSASWTIQSMAERAAMSSFHFARRFAQRFQETPRCYLRRRRLEWARILISVEGVGVTDACVTVGYSSLSSFSTAFRREFGVRPSHAAKTARIKTQTEAIDCCP